jgi:hypothetical protein
MISRCHCGGIVRKSKEGPQRVREHRHSHTRTPVHPVVPSDSQEYSLRPYAYLGDGVHQRFQLLPIAFPNLTHVCCECLVDARTNKRVKARLKGSVHYEGRPVDGRRLFDPCSNKCLGTLQQPRVHTVNPDRCFTALHVLRLASASQLTAHSSLCLSV